MHKGIAFWLMSLYVCAGTEAYQFLKLPALVTHFIQHCEADSDTTLRGFFEEHYQGEDVLDDDWQQDMELPFKTCSCSPVVISPTLAPDIVKVRIPDPFEVHVPLTPVVPELFSKFQAMKIFQPPRTLVITG